MALEERELALAELASALASIDSQAVEALEEMILSASSVLCHGLGRSGLCCRSFAMRLMHLGFQCSVVGEVLARSARERDLLIIASASGGGETLEVVAKKAKTLGTKIALVTSNDVSVLSALADITVHIKAPSKSDYGVNRTSLMPMGTLFEETAFMLFDLIIVDLMRRMRIDNVDMMARHANLE